MACRPTAWAACEGRWWGSRLQATLQLLLLVGQLVRQCQASCHTLLLLRLLAEQREGQCQASCLCFTLLLRLVGWQAGGSACMSSMWDSCTVVKLAGWGLWAGAASCCRASVKE
jgi:hypothetical protein